MNKRQKIKVIILKPVCKNTYKQFLQITDIPCDLRLNQLKCLLYNRIFQKYV